MKRLLILVLALTGCRFLFGGEPTDRGTTAAHDHDWPVFGSSVTHTRDCSFSGGGSGISSQVCTQKRCNICGQQGNFCTAWSACQ